MNPVTAVDVALQSLENGVKRIEAAKGRTDQEGMLEELVGDFRSKYERLRQQQIQNGISEDQLPKLSGELVEVHGLPHVRDKQLLVLHEEEKITLYEERNKRLDHVVIHVTQPDREDGRPVLSRVVEELPPSSPISIGGRTFSTAAPSLYSANAIPTPLTSPVAPRRERAGSSMSTTTDIGLPAIIACRAKL
jgi:hypothetical protein